MDTHRRSFIDNDLLYLFSYDVNLDGEREEIGIVPGGARFNIFSQPKDSRVYQVLHERVGMDVRPLSGVVSWGGDWAHLRKDLDACVIDAQVTIQTDDGAVIQSSYGGVLPTGPSGFRRLIENKPRVGTEDKPVTATLVTTPRYETDAEAYRWLTACQCVAFGRATIIQSFVRQVSFDVYAMD